MRYRSKMGGRLVQ